MKTTNRNHYVDENSTGAWVLSTKLARHAGIYISAVLISAAAPPAYSAQPLAQGALIRVSVAETDLMSKGQVVKLSAGAVATPIITQLSEAGYLTHGADAGYTLDVTVGSYDSGSYIGLAKTAHIGVDYALADAAGDTVRNWHADCTHRVAFNLESTAKRNAAAVTACLDELAQGVAAALRGAP